MSKSDFLLIGLVLLALLTTLFEVDVSTSLLLCAAPVPVGEIEASGGVNERPQKKKNFGNFLGSVLTGGMNLFENLGGLDIAKGVFSTLFGSSQAKKQARYAADLQKELMDYQWNNYMSPQAQASALAQIGLNPGVAFGQGGMSHTLAPNASAPTLPNISPNFGRTSAENILALSEAKRAGSDAAGKDLDNIVKRNTLDEQIKASSIANKWTEEQTNLVMQQAYNLQGLNSKIQAEIDVLKKQGKKLDFENEHWLERFKNEMRQFADQHNIDEQTFIRMEKELPFVLSKIQSEADLLDLEAEMQGDFKEVNASLGVVGQILKFISMFIKKR